MLFLVRFIGLLVSGFGLAMLFNPEMLTRYITFWQEGKRIYLGGVIKFLCSLIFIMGGSNPLCRKPGVIFLIGVLGLVGGIIVFVMGIEKVKKMLKWFTEQPPITAKVFAVLNFLMGALIVFSA